jgi:formate-dependent phosphoribosylglycinamide formyltransferase (GAR transformylase)
VPQKSSTGLRESIQICEGVEFDKIAREWRCKWSPDNDKAALVEAQKALESVLSDVKKVDGVLGVERVVCGGCLDFKVVTTLPAEKFGAWEEKGFAPEAAFVAKLEGIDGITVVETQTYTVR